MGKRRRSKRPGASEPSLSVYWDGTAWNGGFAAFTWIDELPPESREIDLTPVIGSVVGGRSYLETLRLPELRATADEFTDAAIEMGLVGPNVARLIFEARGRAAASRKTAQLVRLRDERTAVADLLAMAENLRADG